MPSRQKYVICRIYAPVHGVLLVQFSRPNFTLLILGERLNGILGLSLNARKI